MGPQSQPFLHIIYCSLWHIAALLEICNVIAPSNFAREAIRAVILSETEYYARISLPTKYCIIWQQSVFLVHNPFNETQ